MTVEQPYNLEGEEALLGALLVDPDWLADVQLVLPATRTDQFFQHKHTLIYGAMCALHADGIDVDLITVKDHLDRNQQLATIGGAAYLTELVTVIATSTSENVLSYARLVDDAARRIPELRRRLESARLPFDEIVSVPPTLEDLFVATVAQGGSS